MLLTLSQAELSDGRPLLMAVAPCASADAKAQAAAALALGAKAAVHGLGAAMDPEEILAWQAFHGMAYMVSTRFLTACLACKGVCLPTQLGEMLRPRPAGGYGRDLRQHHCTGAERPQAAAARLGSCVDDGLPVRRGVDNCLLAHTFQLHNCCVCLAVEKLPEAPLHVPLISVFWACSM